MIKCLLLHFHFCSFLVYSVEVLLRKMVPVGRRYVCTCLLCSVNGIIKTNITYVILLLCNCSHKHAVFEL